MVTDRKIIVSNGNTSVELTALPYRVRRIKGFDTLNVQIVSSQGYNQVGASVINSYVTPRDMSIEGQIKEETTAQMQLLRDKLLNLFLPGKDITVNHFYGGKNRLIVARVEKTPQFADTEVTTVQTFAVELLAPQPYWRDITETLIPLANTVGGIHFPLVIPKTGITFGLKASSLIANVYNYSSINVGMRIEFIAKGAVTNPQLFNVYTRDYIRLLCSMEAGEKITIQTGEDKTVTRNANGISEDYIGRIDLQGGGNTFLELAPGDNLFRYSADDGESQLEVRIYFVNKYPGV